MVSNIAACLRSSSDADCSIVVDPQFKNRDEDFQLTPAGDLDAIADAEWLAKRVPRHGRRVFRGISGQEQQDSVVG